MWEKNHINSFLWNDTMNGTIIFRRCLLAISCCDLNKVSLNCLVASNRLS